MPGSSIMGLTTACNVAQSLPVCKFLAGLCEKFVIFAADYITIGNHD